MNMNLKSVPLLCKYCLVNPANISKSLGVTNLVFARNRTRKTQFPDPPPFFDKADKFSNDFFEFDKKIKDSSIREKMIEGIDYPLMIHKPRERIFASSVLIADPYKIPKNELKMMTSSEPSKDYVSPGVDARTWAKKKRLFQLMRKTMPEFTEQSFLEEAHQIYKNLFMEMTATPMKKEKLLAFCTEHCYPKLIEGLGKLSQVQWQYVETLEPGKIVHVAKCTAFNPDHQFAQLTVRMFSRQILAIYDRFGRLQKGHPTKPRDVLEYVVFERHMDPGEYESNWRVHGKVTDSSGVEDREASFQKHLDNIQTTLIEKSFQPQFPNVKPAERVDPQRWNDKWQDPKYYQLTADDKDRIKKRDLRKRYMFQMKPEKRV